LQQQQQHQPQQQSMPQSTSLVFSTAASFNISTNVCNFLCFAYSGSFLPKIIFCLGYCFLCERIDSIISQIHCVQQ
jgi:hypothetical protein